MPKLVKNKYSEIEHQKETILKSKHSFDYQTLFDGPLNTELILSCFT